MKKSTDNRPLNLSQEISIPSKSLQREELLGEGGFGKVYSGTWRPTTLYKTPVAVKELKQSEFSERVLEGFEAEVTVHSKLEFPHIVKLYGITMEQPYSMVMELMQNGPLDRYLQKNKPDQVTWSFRFQLAQDIALGLQYLHIQQPPIIHADLKSLNVLLDGQFRAKLGDFGLAAIKNETASKTHSSSRPVGGRPSGSLLWMAPELFRRGGGTSLQTDVYAYGMVLWEICTHQYPFPNDAMKGAEVIKDFIKEGDLDPFPSETPEGFQTLGEACRAKEKDKRPTSKKILEILSSLEAQSQAGVGTLSNPPHQSSYMLNSIPETGSSVSTNPYILHSAPKRAAKPGTTPSPYLLHSEKPHAAVKTGSVGLVDGPKTPPGRILPVPPKKVAPSQVLAPQSRLTPRQCIQQRAQEAAKGLKAGEGGEFLKCVMRGSLEGAQRSIDLNRRVVSALGDIKDLSGRTFKQVTALQYAYWALDVEMCELLLSYLPEEEARDQLLAFEQECNDIVEAYGLHYSLGEYQQAIKKYVDNYVSWADLDYREGKEAMATCWVVEVGGAQRGFPAWLIMLMSEEGDNVAWVKQDLSLGFKRYEKYLDEWYVHEGTHVLGTKPNTTNWWYSPACGLSWARGEGLRCVRGDGTAGLVCWAIEGSHDYKFSLTLEATRLAAVESIQNRLCTSVMPIAAIGTY